MADIPSGPATEQTSCEKTVSTLLLSAIIFIMEVGP